MAKVIAVQEAWQFTMCILFDAQSIVTVWDHVAGVYIAHMTSLHEITGFHVNIGDANVA